MLSGNEEEGVGEGGREGLHICYKKGIKTMGDIEEKIPIFLLTTYLT